MPKVETFLHGKERHIVSFIPNSIQASFVVFSRDKNTIGK